MQPVAGDKLPTLLWAFLPSTEVLGAGTPSLPEFIGCLTSQGVKAALSEGQL